MTLDPAHGDDGDGLSKLFSNARIKGKFGRTVTIVTASAAHMAGPLAGGRIGGDTDPGKSMETQNFVFEFRRRVDCSAGLGLALES